MSKFESNPNIKKLDATQLDINFENVPNNSNIEEEKKDVIGTDNSKRGGDTDTGEKENPSNEYYGRFNKYKNEKNPPPSKKPKTQQKKDDDKRKAILGALKKRKNKGNTTGYEHTDPWDMSR